MFKDQLESGFVAVAFSLFALGVLVLLYAVPHTAGIWRLFKRAKKPGWVSLVPFYNTYLQGQVAKKPQIALAANGFLAILVGLVIAAPFASQEVQILMFVATLLFVALLFMTFEELDKHFLKHFGLSKHSLEGNNLYAASKNKNKK